MTTRRVIIRFPAAVLFSIHKFLTALALAFLALHLLSVAANQFGPVSVADMLIPLHSRAREPQITFGILATWSFLIVAFSFSVRWLTGYRPWKQIHWLTLPMTVFAWLHSVIAGSDSATLAMRELYASTAFVFLLLVGLRVIHGRRRPMPRFDAPPAPFDRMSVRSLAGNHIPEPLRFGSKNEIEWESSDFPIRVVNRNPGHVRRLARGE